MEQFYFHVIQDYDTLQGISLEYGVSLNDLKRLNNLSNDTILHLQKLKIPIPQYHKVEIDEERNQKEQKVITSQALQFKYQEINTNVLKEIIEQKNDFESCDQYIKENIEDIKNAQNVMQKFKFLTFFEAIDELKKDQMNLKETLKRLKEETPKMCDFKGKLKVD